MSKKDEGFKKSVAFGLTRDCLFCIASFITEDIDRLNFDIILVNLEQNFLHFD